MLASERMRLRVELFGRLARIDEQLLTEIDGAPSLRQCEVVRGLLWDRRECGEDLRVAGFEVWPVPVECPVAEAV